MVDTANLRLHFSKGARVEWSDAAVPSVVLLLTGRIREPIEISPHYVLIEAFPGQPQTATLTITNREPAPLRIVKVQAGRPDIHANLQEIEPGRKYNLTVTRDPNLPPGGYQSVLELVLEGSKGPNPQIPVTVVQKKQVYLSRSAVVFRSPDGRAEKVALVVEKFGDPRFAVKNLKVDLPFVEAEAAPLPFEQNVARYELRFTLRPEIIPAGRFRGSASFETNDKEFPHFTLAVMGAGRGGAGEARVQ